MSEPQHSSVQAAIPATIEIPSEWFLAKLPLMPRGDQEEYLQILHNQVFESKKKVDSVEVQANAATANALSETKAAERLAAQGQEELKRARDRLALELGRSGYAKSVGSRKHEGLCALLKTVSAVVKEDGPTDVEM